MHGAAYGLVSDGASGEGGEAAVIPGRSGPL